MGNILAVVAGICLVSVAVVVIFCLTADEYIDMK